MGGGGFETREKELEGRLQRPNKHAQHVGHMGSWVPANKRSAHTAEELRGRARALGIQVTVSFVRYAHSISVKMSKKRHTERCGGPVTRCQGFASKPSAKRKGRDECGEKLVTLNLGGG